tara:strand:- start:267240 stop:267881 length:642 start_codon:yes stop_codon:yes gene_type:complete
MFRTRENHRLISAQDALPGRDINIKVAERHYVLDAPLKPQAEYLAGNGLEQAMFGMGCFWGVERHFWSMSGVYTTAAGYAGGFTANPTYQEVCSGQTAHTEVVWVVFDPARLSYKELLKSFWEAHDPTQGMRQGNDSGTQYRSAIYTYSDAQLQAAEDSREHYQSLLAEKGYAPISTEIKAAGDFYYAEDYHQQYLAKNPQGYCSLGGTGVCY